jgi:hypothetical protein
MAIDGTYKGTARAMLGSADFELTLETDGAALTGSASVMGIVAELQNGKADGNSFTCQAEGDGPIGHMVLDISGTVDGDRIFGEAKAGVMTARLEGSRA